MTGYRVGTRRSQGSFRIRLISFAYTPVRPETGPRNIETRNLWNHRQRIVAGRIHWSKKWVERNGRRTAYAVNMHLSMLRDRTERIRPIKENAPVPLRNRFRGYQARVFARP